MTSNGDADRLNDAFGIDGRVAFDAGAGGMARARLRGDGAEAEVYLHGAHVTAFRPGGGESVLWMSPLAAFVEGKAIRGGIPIVFPWFGPHPHDAGKPQHGFARTAAWRVTASDVLGDGRATVRLGLDDGEETRLLWPHFFALELAVTVGASLELALTVRNTGDTPFTVGAALHTYLAVSDIAGVAIDGFDRLQYIDKTDGGRRRRQDGAVIVAGEVDRVYLGVPGDCRVRDAGHGRDIVLAQRGSRSVVVWNPWVEKARRMADFPDEGYRTMVCVEAVNTGDDAPTLPPGGVHTLAQTVAVELHASDG